MRENIKELEKVHGLPEFSELERVTKRVTEKELWRGKKEKKFKKRKEKSNEQSFYANTVYRWALTILNNNNY